jgi:hypothetical protein
MEEKDYAVVEKLLRKIVLELIHDYDEVTDTSVLRINGDSLMFSKDELQAVHKCIYELERGLYVG